MKKESKYGKLWSRDELVLALYLYCQIPFGQAHTRNQEVVQLAMVIGRTPAAVARKLGNFGSFDPLLAQRGIKGLVNAGKHDKEIWNEFYGRWDALVSEANLILSADDYLPDEPDKIEDDYPIIVRPKGPSSAIAEVNIRRHQAFFRRAVLSSYRSSCCVCGLGIRQMLVASHIIPWSVNENTRTDPQNGLCLCSLHDCAYDAGLLSVDFDLKIRLQKTLFKKPSKVIQMYFLEYHDQQIRAPEKFGPNPEFLAWRNREQYQLGHNSL